MFTGNGFSGGVDCIVLEHMVAHVDGLGSRRPPARFFRTFPVNLAMNWYLA